MYNDECVLFIVLTHKELYHQPQEGKKNQQRSETSVLIF